MYGHVTWMTRVVVDPADEDPPQRSAPANKRFSVRQKAMLIDSNRNEEPGIYSKHRVSSGN